MMRVLKFCCFAVLLLAVAVSMQGCGKKSRLKSPEGATFPRQYPAP